MTNFLEISSNEIVNNFPEVNSENGSFRALNLEAGITLGRWCRAWWTMQGIWSEHAFTR